MGPHKNKSCKKLPQPHYYSISWTCTYMYQPASYCNKIQKTWYNEPTFFSEVLVVCASVHLTRSIWVISDSWLSLSLADQVGSVLCTNTWQEEHQLLCESDLRTKQYFANIKSQYKKADAVCSSIRRWQCAVKLTTLNTRNPAKVSKQHPPPQEIFFVSFEHFRRVTAQYISLQAFKRHINITGFCLCAKSVKQCPFQGS